MSLHATEKEAGSLNVSDQQFAWRREVVNRLSLLFVLLGMPLWLFMIANWEISYMVPTAIYGVLCLTVVLRTAESTNVRAHIICLALLATGIWAMLQSGLDGTG